jgi:hydrogenase maturation protease
MTMNNFKILLIGYGNTLRNDDGVGVRIAEIIAEENRPHVQVIATHQLTPELAARYS